MTCVKQEVIPEFLVQIIPTPVYVYVNTKRMISITCPPIYYQRAGFLLETRRVQRLAQCLRRYRPGLFPRAVTIAPRIYLQAIDPQSGANLPIARLEVKAVLI
jgi:hypothetical protein